MLIDVMRHGSTGRSGFLDGRTDRALVDEGWAQFYAQTAGRGWPRIVTSPLMRARVAAELLAAEARVPLAVDAGWAEYDFGAWDGRARAEIEATADGAAALAAFYADPLAHPPPGGEGWVDFSSRVEEALLRVVRSEAGPVLVVTHAGPLRLALAIATGIDRSSLWALRISYGTRVRLNAGLGKDGQIWGEIIEIAQPCGLEV